MTRSTIGEGDINEGIELKIRRLRVGLKQYRVAAEVGIAPTQLCEIESGRRKPSPELLARIVEVIQGGHDGERKQQN